MNRRHVLNFVGQPSSVLNVDGEADCDALNPCATVDGEVDPVAVVDGTAPKITDRAIDPGQNIAAAPADPGVRYIWIFWLVVGIGTGVSALLYKKSA